MQEKLENHCYQNCPELLFLELMVLVISKFLQILLLQRQISSFSQ